MSDSFRCAAGSIARAEPLVGTASTVRAFLLVEAPGAWGVDAVRDNQLPDLVKSRLARRANAHGVRLLLIRRHGRSTARDMAVFAAYADPAAPWVETTRLGDPTDLLDLDLAGLGSGRSASLTPYESPLFLVCTHGKHDVCCAELGRPLAAALQTVEPEATWEVSHIGGDRFAGNALVLPDGLYYGRLTPEGAVTLAARWRNGHLDLDHLRGRCGYPFLVQAAEVFLRRELGCTGSHALALTGRSSEGAETWAVFTDGSRSWTVRVRSTLSPAEQLTCRAKHGSRGTTYTLVSITPD